MRVGIIISNESSKYKEQLKSSLPSYLLHFSCDTNFLSHSVRSGNLTFIAFSIDVVNINFHKFFKMIKTCYKYVPAFLIMSDSVKKYAMEEIEGYIGYKVERVFSFEEEILEFINVVNFLPDVSKKVVENIRKVYSELIGDSAFTEELRYFVLTSARHNLPVLLQGKTGCGKSLVARLIHETSNREEEPFVVVDLGAIPEDLMESTLFGAKKGSFTGTCSDIKGVIEAANGGTLFLDEIENASPALQAKLLRVLETGMVRPLGDVKEKFVDFRLICASNKNIKAMIRKKKFRQDLGYRIAGCCFEILPLHERKEDIDALAKHFCTNNCYRITEESIGKLRAQIWLGNVRELINVLNVAFINAEPLKVIFPEHIKIFDIV